MISNESRHSILSSQALERVLCMLLGGLLLWKGILPAWHILNTDFPNYYLVARLLREGYSLDRIYDWIWLQRIKDHWGLDQSLVGFAGLTPLSALPIVPLSFYAALTAKRIWIVINLLFLVSGTELLRRSTSLSRRSIWLLSLLAIVPLRTSFLYGQMHLFVLFLLIIAYFFYRRNREVACGICIALAAGLKVYPLFFAFFFLWKRQWRPALSVLATSATMIVFAGWWMGWDVLHIYAIQILPRSLQGEVLDPYNLHAASAAALFHRLLLFEPSLNSSPLIRSSLLYAIIYPLWQCAVLIPLFAFIGPASPGTYNDQLEWATFLLALLVLSPVPSSYHFVVAILSIVLLIDFTVRQNETMPTISFIGIYAAVSAIDLINFGSLLNSSLAMLFGFARFWLTIALYALSVIGLWRYRSVRTRWHSALNRKLLAAFALVIFVTGFMGYQYHFKYRRLAMRHRIASSATYLATDPQPTEAGYLSVAMVPEGYRILDQHGTEVAHSFYSSADQLSYARNGNASFLELADASGSRIVRASDGTTITQDAELPALSSDGRTMAFIRESKGQGSLWIVSLDEPRTPGHSDTSNLPTPLIPVIDDADYDVRRAAFLHSGDILFLAKHDGQLSLFQVKQGENLVPWIDLKADIRSFAVSPDEGHVALTELVQNRWQLSVWNVVTHRQKQLTFGDCNAYAPAWLDGTKLLYATDCGRGLGLTAIGLIDSSNVPDSLNTKRVHAARPQHRRLIWVAQKSELEQSKISAIVQ